MLRLAIPKGRLLGPSLALLARAGLELEEDPRTSRRLVFSAHWRGQPLRVFVIRAPDVPVFVERGAADAGIAGRDLLLEHRPRVFEPVDLGIGRCRLVVAAPEAMAREGLPAPGARVRVATKYANLARGWFAARGVEADVVRLYGSIELAPLAGLAGRIVDLVETGNTLRANGLVEEATIADITSRWIVNPASWRTRTDLVTWTRGLRQAVGSSTQGGCGRVACGD